MRFVLHRIVGRAVRRWPDCWASAAMRFGKPQKNCGQRVWRWNRFPGAAIGSAPAVSFLPPRNFEPGWGPAGRQRFGPALPQPMTERARRRPRVLRDPCWWQPQYRRQGAGAGDAPSRDPGPRAHRSTRRFRGPARSACPGVFCLFAAPIHGGAAPTCGFADLRFCQPVTLSTCEVRIHG